ncbi:uncharacterized protein MKK02DRAFT_39977 [Dioszegia hungarica]|uniref:DUF7918 domain-containing protein n=1 Tax=Dioszegia hungarica TaxID=4972 RepID=A0AA38HF98_9TREE|nr:uncharacterized protein MKK02DRAFT_39977 [Dioszegia hungarica]KAI9639655.1 hypothetical protein MKK02DRAFT_39977 [Dioszegia hungarica]
MLYTSPDLNIEAWVEFSDGRKLNEHRLTRVRDDKTGQADALCKAYLECEEGESFKVKLSAPPYMMLSQPGLVAYLYIDGRSVDGRHWPRPVNQVTFETLFKREGGQMFSCDLAFAALSKTDDEGEVTCRGAEVDNLCRIEVVVRRGSKRPSQALYAPKSAGDVGKVHEKQIKLGSTVVGKNQKVFVPGGSSHFVPDPRRPDVARFQWTYHTKSKLSIMGIIEDEPEEAPLPNPRKRRQQSSASAEAADLDDVDDGIQAVDAPVVKKEKKARASGVKQEPIPVYEYGTGTSSGNRNKVDSVIDLTGDD